jgi:hypothetical protein
MRSMRRLYNGEQLRVRESLETVLRRAGVTRQPPASKDVNREVEVATALVAVTRRQPVKTADLMRAGVCVNWW